MSAHIRRLTAVAVAVAIFSGCSASVDPGMNVRKDYQTHVDNQSSSFDADAGIYVSDSQMFVTQAIHQGSCTQRCAVFKEKSDGSYKVYLPIGFQTPKNEQEAATIGTVTELVYWDPVRHERVELPGADSMPILIPGTLVRRTTDDLRIGETAYIATGHVHAKVDSRNEWVIETAAIWHEPIGLDYNMTVVVRITRTNNGIDVCAPPEQDYPLSSTELKVGLPVVNLSHAC